MYIRQEKKKKGSSVFRVFILTMLILGGLVFIKEQPQWARPFEPTPTATPPAIFYVNEGDIHFAEGRLHQAIAAYEQAIILEPDNDIPYIRQAKLLIYVDDTAKALIRAEKAVLLNPDKAENLAGYCQALDWEGQYGLAFEACECAIELDENYAPAHAYLSEVYSDQGYWTAAQKNAQVAIDTEFQSPEAHHNMGYALEVQGRYASAVEYYENAITLRPKLAPFYMAAGRNYYWLGRLDKAADLFGEAIKLDPTNPVGYDQIGWTFHTNGQDGRAIDALEQAISVDPLYGRAWGRLGTIYYLRQNYEEAIKILPIAIELSEHERLNKVRKLEVLTQIEGTFGPESVPILQGRFIRGRGTESNLLIATLNPIQWVQNTLLGASGDNCGHFIANTIQNQIIRTSPTQDITFSEVFSQTSGTATLNLGNGKLSLSLKNMPQPKTVPYELQVYYRPNTAESLGYFQPDGLNQVDTEFTIVTDATAPVEYYYELGLSYAYITPRQCEAAIPWLLKSLEKNQAYYNPAWEGLKLCPSVDSPPTPLPTFTPIPEETG